MTFREFVQSRMEPFEAMQLPYGMALDGILRADLNWLMEAAKVPPDSKKPHGLAWISVEGARRVSDVCHELATYSDVPLLATVKSVWNRMYPAPCEERLRCPYCNGMGWVIVEGEFGTSAARPCSHQPPTESELCMGVRISPAVRRHYIHLEQDAAQRRKRWIGSGGKPEPIRETIARVMEAV